MGDLNKDLLYSFAISIMAGVISHYICKWLDRNNELR